MEDLQAALVRAQDLSPRFREAVRAHQRGEVDWAVMRQAAVDLHGALVSVQRLTRAHLAAVDEVLADLVGRTHAAAAQEVMPELDQLRTERASLADQIEANDRAVQELARVIGDQLPPAGPSGPSGLR